MKRTICALIIVAIGLAAAWPVHADQLDDIRAAGTLRVAVFCSNPPFGGVNPVSHRLVGYYVDFADAIARRHTADGPNDPR